MGLPYSDFRDLSWQLNLHLCTNAGHLKPPVPELLARGLWSCHYFNCILQRELPRHCPSPIDRVFLLFDPPRFPGDRECGRTWETNDEISDCEPRDSHRWCRYRYD